jgi:hypothetical protein
VTVAGRSPELLAGRLKVRTAISAYLGLEIEAIVMANYFPFASPPDSMLGKLATSMSEMWHRLIGTTRIQPLPIMSRRQQLAAMVDAAKRTRQR